MPSASTTDSPESPGHAVACLAFLEQLAEEEARTQIRLTELAQYVVSPLTCASGVPLPPSSPSLCGSDNSCTATGNKVNFSRSSGTVVHNIQNNENALDLRRFIGLENRPVQPPKLTPAQLHLLLGGTSFLSLVTAHAMLLRHLDEGCCKLRRLLHLHSAGVLDAVTGSWRKEGGKDVAESQRKRILAYLTLKDDEYNTPTDKNLPFDDVPLSFAALLSALLHTSGIVRYFFAEYATFTTNFLCINAPAMIVCGNSCSSTNTNCNNSTSCSGNTSNEVETQADTGTRDRKENRRDNDEKSEYEEEKDSSTIAIRTRYLALTVQQLREAASSTGDTPSTNKSSAASNSEMMHTLWDAGSLRSNTTGSGGYGALLRLSTVLDAIPYTTRRCLVQFLEQSLLVVKYGVMQRMRRHEICRTDRARKESETLHSLLASLHEIGVDNDGHCIGASGLNGAAEGNTPTTVFSHDNSSQPSSQVQHHRRTTSHHLPHFFCGEHSTEEEQEQAVNAAQAATASTALLSASVSSGVKTVKSPTSPAMDPTLTLAQSWLLSWSDQQSEKPANALTASTTTTGMRTAPFRGAAASFAMPPPGVLSSPVSPLGTSQVTQTTTVPATATVHHVPTTSAPVASRLPPAVQLLRGLAGVLPTAPRLLYTAQCIAAALGVQAAELSCDMMAHSQENQEGGKEELQAQRLYRQKQQETRELLYMIRNRHAEFVERGTHIVAAARGMAYQQLGGYQCHALLFSLDRPLGTLEKQIIQMQSTAISATSLLHLPVMGDEKELPTTVKKGMINRLFGGFFSSSKSSNNSTAPTNKNLSSAAALQAALISRFANTPRVLIHHGRVRKRYSRVGSLHERYIILCSDVLFYVEEIEDRAATMTAVQSLWEAAQATAASQVDLMKSAKSHLQQYVETKKKEQQQQQQHHATAISIPALAPPLSSQTSHIRTTGPEISSKGKGSGGCFAGLVSGCCCHARGDSSDGSPHDARRRVSTPLDEKSVLYAVGGNSTSPQSKATGGVSERGSLLAGDAAKSTIRISGIENDNNLTLPPSLRVMKHRLRAVFPLRQRPPMRVIDCAASDTQTLPKDAEAEVDAATGQSSNAVVPERHWANRDCCFVLVAPSRSYVFYADTIDEKERWVTAIQEAVAAANPSSEEKKTMSKCHPESNIVCHKTKKRETETETGMATPRQGASLTPRTPLNNLEHDTTAFSPVEGRETNGREPSNISNQPLRRRSLSVNLASVGLTVNEHKEEESGLVAGRSDAIGTHSNKVDGGGSSTVKWGVYTGTMEMEVVRMSMLLANSIHNIEVVEEQTAVSNAAAELHKKAKELAHSLALRCDTNTDRSLVNRESSFLPGGEARRQCRRITAVSRLSVQYAQDLILQQRRKGGDIGHWWQSSPKESLDKHEHPMGASGEPTIALSKTEPATTISNSLGYLTTPQECSAFSSTKSGCESKEIVTNINDDSGHLLTVEAAVNCNAPIVVSPTRHHSRNATGDEEAPPLSTPLSRSTTRWSTHFRTWSAVAPVIEALEDGQSEDNESNSDDKMCEEKAKSNGTGLSGCSAREDKQEPCSGSDDCDTSLEGDKGLLWQV